ASHHLRNRQLFHFFVLVIFGINKKSRETPSMARATMIPTLLVLLLVVCCATTVVQGKEWVVGDNKGWSFGVSGWESGKDIQSGDVLGENSKDQVIGFS
uniref:Phytocyanin domain-containing protein n=1 Tax=Aegilops tauschii subsp. strangulata TaxID=200361 RepID=A0A453M6X5_AEGTS